MRRIFVIAGILLLPFTALAQGTTPPALSPWVVGVLAVADRGIGFAAGTPAATTCDPVSVESEIENTRSFINERVNEILLMESESEMLRERTVCYESDRRILQDKLKEILEAIGDATGACRFQGVEVLKQDFAFVMEAYRSFLRGGSNPSYKDDILRYKYPFESQVLWETLTDREYDSASTQPFCAYTTDYAIHSIGYIPTAPGGAVLTDDIRSYGCDADVLGRIQAPLDAEAGTLKTFIEKTDEFARSVYDTVSQALFNLDEILNQLNEGGEGGVLPGALPAPDHDVRTGCLQPLPPDGSSPPEYMTDLTAAYPEYFDAGNASSASAGGYAYGPAPGEVLPEGLLLQPIVDYLLTWRNAGILSRSFLERLEDAGYARPLPVEEGVSEQVSHLMMLRESERIDMMRLISVNNEQEKAYLVGFNRDAMQRMGSASVPLEAAVDSLVDVVENELPQKYIPQLTYFLGRSCVDGHCQETLKAVTKRVFNPYCHPFVSGLYVDEEAHLKCFCDPEVEGSWSDFDKYCDDDFSTEQARYDAMPETLIPACLEETASGSSL